MEKDKMSVIDLKGKIAIVTGGAMGIGKAICEGFAQESARIAIADLDETAAQATAGEIKEKFGVECIAVKTNVTNKASIQAMAKTVNETFGGIDILVNNAGGLFGTFSVEEHPEDAWDKTIELNLKSVFLCSQAVIPYLSDKTGRIISVTSISGFTGGGLGGVAYGAAKGGVITFTRNLAHELGPRSITVNAIALGIVETRLHKDDSAEKRKMLLDKMPLRTYAQPEDMAGIVLLLASQAGRHITGEIVQVNGGLLMI